MPVSTASYKPELAFFRTADNFLQYIASRQTNLNPLARCVAQVFGGSLSLQALDNGNRPRLVPFVFAFQSAVLQACVLLLNLAWFLKSIHLPLNFGAAIAVLGCFVKVQPACCPTLDLVVVVVASLRILTARLHAENGMGAVVG